MKTIHVRLSPAERVALDIRAARAGLALEELVAAALLDELRLELRHHLEAQSGGLDRMARRLRGEVV
jgi:hypothetical protein